MLPFAGKKGRVLPRSFFLLGLVLGEALVAAQEGVLLGEGVQRLGVV